MRGGAPLRGHQELSVDACTTDFAKGAGRVSVIMVTDTGKTLVALNTVQEIAPHGNALVVMPTLELLEQTAAVWRREDAEASTSAASRSTTPITTRCAERSPSAWDGAAV